MLVLLSWEMEGEMAKFGKQQKVNKISVMILHDFTELLLLPEEKQ